MRRPTMRLAYWTGIRRWACSTKTTNAMTTRPTRQVSTKVKSPRLPMIEANWLGMTAMIEVKMRIDMPLPMPRSVMSSPNHMMIEVPAVITTIMTMRTQMASFGMIDSLQPLNSAPGVRASEMIAVDCRIARPMVR